MTPHLLLFLLAAAPLAAQQPLDARSFAPPEHSGGFAVDFAAMRQCELMDGIDKGLGGLAMPGGPLGCRQEQLAGHDELVDDNPWAGPDPSLMVGPKAGLLVVGPRGLLQPVLVGPVLRPRSLLGSRRSRRVPDPLQTAGWNREVPTPSVASWVELQ